MQPISNQYFGVNGFQQGGIAGKSATNASKTQEDINKFENLVKSLQEEKASQSAQKTIESIGQEGLTGDYTSSLTSNIGANETSSSVQGFAANLSNSQGLSESKTIDRTSKLYEKSLELESYFVKIMLSSMRNTVSKTSLSGENNHAQTMYEDMLYDEMSVSMTKNAGFGLADQVYLQLSE
ncbi:MAG: rod-binding protein [Treponemataceae bacterium]